MVAQARSPLNQRIMTHSTWEFHVNIRPYERSPEKNNVDNLYNFFPTLKFKIWKSVTA